jgi:uncharacterized lipoprotein
MLTLLCASLVSACGGLGRTRPQFPSAADVEKSQEAKPLPTPAIVTDPAARETYNADVESWGDRVADAAVRMCRSMNDMGGNFACGETSSERMERLAPR